VVVASYQANVNGIFELVHGSLVKVKVGAKVITIELASECLALED
jgi:hypothetical protein